MQLRSFALFASRVFLGKTWALRIAGSIKKSPRGDSPIAGSPADFRSAVCPGTVTPCPKRSRSARPRRGVSPFVAPVSCRLS